MAGLVALFALAVAGVSLLLAGVSGLAATRTRSTRFSFAAVAFLVFAGKGVLVVGDGAGWFASPMPWNAWTVGVDASIVGLLYLAVVKR